MRLKADNPQVQEIIASWQRDALGISIIDVAVYESATGKTLGEHLGPLSNIIPVNKLLEMFAAIYPDFKADTLPESFTSEAIRTFVQRIAVHAASKISSGNTTEVGDLFILCELSLKDGTEETRMLAVSFLEDFQTVLFNERVDINVIRERMHPLAAQLWKEIDEYWKAAAEYKMSKTKDL